MTATVSARRLAAGGGLTLLTMLGVVPMASPALAAAGGHNGTVDIHADGTAAGDARNEPKVCAFSVVASDFDPGQVLSYWFLAGEPFGGPHLLSGTLTADAAGAASTGTLHLADGHYKLSFDTGQGPGSKSKVFTADCSAEQPAVPPSDPPPAPETPKDPPPAPSVEQPPTDVTPAPPAAQQPPAEQPPTEQPPTDPVDNPPVDTTPVDTTPQGTTPPPPAPPSAELPAAEQPATELPATVLPPAQAPPAQQPPADLPPADLPATAAAPPGPAAPQPPVDVAPDAPSASGAGAAATGQLPVAAAQGPSAPGAVAPAHGATPTQGTGLALMPALAPSLMPVAQPVALAAPGPLPVIAAPASGGAAAAGLPQPFQAHAQGSAVPGQLARTGTGSRDLIGLGGLLTALGALMTPLGRRRTARTA